MKYNFENYAIVEQEDGAKKKRWHLSDFAELYKSYETKPIADIIRAEKNSRGLSYTDLAKMVKKMNLSCMIPYIDNKNATETKKIMLIEERIRQVLRNKNPEMEVIEALCVALEIKDTLEQRLTVYLYDKQNYNKQPGRMTENKKKENQTNYEKIQNDVNDNELPLVEKAIIAALTESYYYEGEWIESELYNALIEERQETEMLKKLLLVNNQFPNEMKKFLEQFEVEEDDTEYMEKIRIEIIR